MKKRLLLYLFEHNKDIFSDFFVRDMVGEIPKAVNDDALRFLATGKEKLSKWIHWNAYLLGRRMVQPQAKPDIIQGMLIFMKTLQTAIDRYEPRVPVDNSQPTVKAEDSFDSLMKGVDEFKHQKTDGEKT